MLIPQKIVIKTLQKTIIIFHLKANIAKKEFKSQIK